MANDPNELFFAARMGGTAFILSLGGEILEIGGGKSRMRLPYAPQLVGDPDTGVVHGGVITAMLDQTCGVAVASALKEIMPFATLDLRIDYMKPAKPRTDIFVEAECLKVTHEVAFTRGIAYQTARDEPIALSTGAFMLIRDRDSKPAA
ncbi:MAG TPA: PaaI family thioesterase [Rhizomicrobium sp.]|nr:PaaI family thioesterase [Rhizomicrobium sp.]